MQTIEVNYEKASPDAILPSYQHPGDAGADLSTIEEVNIFPHQVVAVSTGLKVAVPDGYAMLVCSRSGMARDLGLMVCNSPGVVDSSFRGVVKVILLNTSDKAIHFRAGTRVAQALFVPVARANFVSSSLDATSRGEGGFGSSGH